MADIFRRHGEAYRARHPMAVQQRRVMRAIETCRTAVLGGHGERCGHCDHHRVSYNSCRNRHCPKCQTTARRQWVERRKGELLPIEYFHVVFTNYGLLASRTKAATLACVAACSKPPACCPRRHG